MLKYYCASIELLNEESLFDDLLKKVNSMRKEKVLRCKREMDQKRSLLAGLLLRFALLKEGLDYDTLHFAVTQEGKPKLCIEPEIYFSLSHSKDYVGCLISDQPVGLDLESGDKPIEVQKVCSLAQKVCNEKEMDIFSLKDSEEKKKYFLECWTKKEAYSKALGKGLQMDFSQINTEKHEGAFWSTWTKDGYCVSMYREGGNYQELSVEKIRSVDCF